MKLLKSLFSALAIVGMAACLSAQEAAPAVEAEPAEAPVVAKQSIDELLAFVPEVVATRKGETALTKDKFIQQIKPQISGAIEAGLEISPEMMQAFAYEAANQLVMHDVILEAALAAGCKADEAAAKDYLEKMKAEADKEQPGLFAQQLMAAGMTEDLLLSRICESQIFESFQEQILAKVEKPADVTEEEAKQFYDENIEQMRTPTLLSAAHILVQFPSQSPSEDEKAAALKTAQEIRASLADDGSNFAEIAAEKSDCPSKQDGGDLGQFPQGRMVVEFEEALLKLKEGEISDPVETIFGYHIIKAGPTQLEQTTPFEEVKDKIIEFLGRNKQGAAEQEAIGEFISKLMEEADIKILLPEPKLEEEEEEEEPAEEDVEEAE